MRGAFLQLNFEKVPNFSTLKFQKNTKKSVPRGDLEKTGPLISKLHL